MRTVASVALVLVLAACAGVPPGPGGLPAEREANVGALMRLDANRDGLLDRVELDAGLRQEYAAVDGNRDGRLNPPEFGEENARRWRLEGPAATPLIDWNQDGAVDYAEFANATRGLFDMVDQDRNGALSVQELVVARRVPRGPQADRGGVPPRRAP